MSTERWDPNDIPSSVNSTCEKIQLPGPLSEVSRWALFGLLVAIMATTVIANLFVIIQINRHRAHKPVTRFYITSMACIDSCVGLAIMPYQIVNITFPTFDHFRYSICDAMNSLDVLLSSASIIHLTVLTFERYVALCHPFSYSKWCSNSNMAAVYVMLWIITSAASFAIIIPGYNEYGVDVAILTCFEGFMMSGANCLFIVGIYYMVLSSSITILIPIIIAVFLNLRVLAHVKREFKHSASMRAASGVRKDRKAVKVSRTLAILTGCFLFCWCPFFISNAVCVLLNYEFPFDVMTVVTWIGYANSGANPLLYMFLQRSRGS